MKRLLHGNHAAGLILSIVFLGIVPSAKAQNVTTKHYIHCQAGDSSGAEFSFIETENEYLISIRERTFNGNTLGEILDKGIDPNFNHSTQLSGFLALEAHVPKSVPNLPAEPASTCQFSNFSTSLVNCGLGSVSVSPNLTDGVISTAIWSCPYLDRTHLHKA